MPCALCLVPCALCLVPCLNSSFCFPTPCQHNLVSQVTNTVFGTGDSPSRHIFVKEVLYGSCGTFSYADCTTAARISLQCLTHFSLTNIPATSAYMASACHSMFGMLPVICDKRDVWGILDAVRTVDWRQLGRLSSRGLCVLCVFPKRVLHCYCASYGLLLGACHNTTALGECVCRPLKLSLCVWSQSAGSVLPSTYTPVEVDNAKALFQALFTRALNNNDKDDSSSSSSSSSGGMGPGTGGGYTGGGYTGGGYTQCNHMVPVCAILCK